MGTAGSHPLGDSSAQWLTNGEKACGRGASSGMGSLSHPHPFCSVRRTASIRYAGADIVSRPISVTGWRATAVRIVPAHEKLPVAGLYPFIPLARVRKC